MRVRSAESRTDLGSKSWVDAANGVTLAQAITGRFVQIEVLFTGTDAGATPVLYDLTVQPRCGS